MDQANRWQAKVLNAIEQSRMQGNQDGISSPTSLDGRLYKDYSERFRAALLSRLKYREMEDRHERIADAYTQTFEWIFKTPRETQKGSDFDGFLRGHQGLYWVTGKPGAGKSTLMKFISEDPRTKTALEVWASGKELFLSSFYFWCSGTEIQMSLAGFMRTLLHDALKQLPYLVSTVFSERWEIFVVLGDLVAWEEPWTMAEIFRALKILVQETTKTTKMAFIIDGLDEFHGNYSEQIELINLLQSFLGSNNDVKICVSSRPWNIFEDAFKSRPSLRLEDLTFPDIQHYVTSHLSSNPGFAALQRLDSGYASKLIHNVTTKASGVFLWVILVVGSLLEGLTNGERLLELQQRLDSLPADLESLFWKILNSVDFERASQLLQIVKVAKSPLTLLELSFADEEDPEFLLKIPTAPLTDEQKTSRAVIMRRRLNGCCKGLLEAEPYPESEIGYLHRTVRDFIQRPDIWKKLAEGTKSSFNPRMQLCIAQITRFKTAGHSPYGQKNSKTKFNKVFETKMRMIVSEGPGESRLRAYLLNELIQAAIDLFDTHGSQPANTGQFLASVSGFQTFKQFLQQVVECLDNCYPSVWVQSAGKWLWRHGLVRTQY
jgi:hypothetical protein